MDALKLISESSMKKENVPAFNIGDTVRAVYRFLRVLLSPRSTAASARPSLLDVLLTAAVSREFSLSTHLL